MVVLILFLFLFFLSAFLRKWLEKNSNELIGRKITLGELHINYLKIAVKAKDFVMYETNRTDSFISFNELYVNFDPWHLLRNEYYFSHIALIRPRVFVGQDGALFNFSDLFSEKDSATTDEIPDSTAPRARQTPLRSAPPASPEIPPNNAADDCENTPPSPLGPSRLPFITPISPESSR